MNYELEFTEEAVTDLEKLTQVIQIRIINKINWLAQNFEQLTPQPLTGDLTDFYKLRVGDYRILYTFSNEPNIIIIHQIGHRREIYK
ncbi:MAG: type II toxin-antitoxin system RelE/ParE family toxin [Cyanobacteria bacterium J06632_19]